MNLSYFFILFLVPTAGLYSMDYNSSDKNSDSWEEQSQTNFEQTNLDMLLRAAEKRNSARRHDVIQELTAEERNALLGIDYYTLEASNYSPLAEKINKNNLPTRQAPTNQNSEFIKDAYIESNDSEDLEETSFMIPNGHFAMCFYTQLATAQSSLLVVSPNLYLTEKNGCYNFLNNANPHYKEINEFQNLYECDAIKKHIVVIMAHGLNSDLCKKTETSFSAMQGKFKLNFFNLDQIKSKKTILIKAKLYKKLDEYVSCCTIQDKKGDVYYIQPLSSTCNQLANPDLKKCKR